MRKLSLKCRHCGKFLPTVKDPENIVTGREHAWDGEPIEDWFAHKMCPVNNKETE